MSSHVKGRIVIWAGAGFIVACCWVLYTFLASPESLGTTLNEPVVKAAVLTTCPVSVAGRYFPLPFWSVPLMNAAAYAVIGLMVETLRRKASPRLAI